MLFIILRESWFLLINGVFEKMLVYFFLDVRVVESVVGFSLYKWIRIMLSNLVWLLIREIFGISVEYI